MPLFPLFRSQSAAILFLAMAGFSASSYAQTSTLPAALPEDVLPELKTILNSAVQQSPTMLARSIEIAKSEADKIVAASGQWPTVGGSFQYADTTTAVSSNTKARISTQGPLYNVYLSQPLYAWGTLKAQTDIGKLQIKIAEHQFADAYRMLALTIRAQYLGLIQKKLVLKNQRYNQRLADENLQLQESRYKNGAISAGDVNGPRLQADEAHLFVDRAIEDYDLSRRALARLAGLKELLDAAVPTEVPKPTFARDTLATFFEGMKNESGENSFQAQVYRDTIRQYELTYKIAKYRLYPKFYFNPSFSKQNTTNVVSTSNGLSPTQTATTITSVAVTANWSLFDGFATRGAKLSALATKRLAERNYQTLLESTGDQARALEKQILFAGRLMDLVEQRNALSAAAVSRTTDDVRLGSGTQTSVQSTTQVANGAFQAALAARADFFARWSEYVSLLGADPVLNNLPPRYLRNGK